MVAPKRYDPVGRCIYCPATVIKWDGKLTEEHIIPKQLGGRLRLPEASCSKCQNVTSGIETDCERQYFYGVRRHLGLVLKKGELLRTIRTEIGWLTGSTYEGISRE